MESLPDAIPFGDVLPLLGQFSSESNRLSALKAVRPHLVSPTDSEVEDVLAQFGTESNKHCAFEQLQLMRDR